MADQRMTRNVKDQWPELLDLFAVGEDVQALVGSRGWQAIMAVLDGEVARIDADLDRAGEPKSQAEYAMAHGRRDGLSSCRRAAEAIISTAAERLDEQRKKHEGAAESAPGR